MARPLAFGRSRIVESGTLSKPTDRSQA